MSESVAGWRLPGSAQVPLRPVTKTGLAYLQIRQQILEGESIRALSRQHPPENDPASAVYYNRYLHRAIYTASGNAVLVEILDSLWDLSDRYKLIVSRSVAGVAAAPRPYESRDDGSDSHDRR